MSSKSSYIYDNKRLFWVTRTPNTSNALLPSLHSQHIKFVALVVWESITTKMTDDNSTTLSETIKLILLDDHSVTSVLSSPSLLEQRMKVWKKKGKKKEKKSFKSHIAQDKHLNSVSLPIYRELISSFFLVPVEKHFLNFSFSLPFFSRCISGKLLPLSFCRSIISVGYKSDFLSHIFGWL